MQYTHNCDKHAYCGERPCPWCMRDGAVESLLAERDARILELLHDRGPMTADEIAAALRVGPLSARPRVCELHKLGRIEDTGERRPTPYGATAAVWRVTEK